MKTVHEVKITAEIEVDTDDLASVKAALEVRNQLEGVLAAAGLQNVTVASKQRRRRQAPGGGT